MPTRLYFLRTLAFVIAVGVATNLACTTQTRTPDRYLIPKSFHGVFRVYYGVANRPALPFEADFHLLKIPANGKLETSSPLESGAAKDEFYFVDGEKREKIDTSPTATNELIQGGNTIQEGVMGAISDRDAEAKRQPPAYTLYFVGSKAEYDAEMSKSTLIKN